MYTKAPPSRKRPHAVSAEPDQPRYTGSPCYSLTESSMCYIYGQCRA